MFICRKGKTIVVYPYERALISNKKKQMTGTCNMDESQIITLSERSQTLTSHTNKSVYLMILLYKSAENEDRPIVTEGRSMVPLGQSETWWWVRKARLQKCSRKLLGRCTYPLPCLG